MRFFPPKKNGVVQLMYEDVASFVPFASFIDAAFWSEVNRKKLHKWKLDTSPVPITGLHSIYDTIGYECRLSFSHDSFESSTAGYSGTLFTFNTIDDFKQLDKMSFLNDRGSELWSAITSNAWLENANMLNRFSFLLFPDLKKFQYFYWLCTPAVRDFPRNIRQKITTSDCNPAHLLQYHAEHNSFVFLLYDGNFYPMADIAKAENFDNLKIVFIDPSPVESAAGWPLRNLISALAVLKPNCNRATFISLRGTDSLKEFQMSWDTTEIPVEPSFTGWETNAQGKLLPRVVDMKRQFDPKRLMEQAVGLNLSLIKWRLVPEMKLDRLSNLKVLIFGAGTLGCNIARNLLAYNVKTISFVDNSTVSYSNPVRQSLSKFDDARLSRGKAETAVNALREIYPSVDAHGHNVTVPMPGHSVSPAGEAGLRDDVTLLESLVESHDVLFLALDSREARWLPTVLANKYGKMAFSVALGFDTYVVIRHGVSSHPGCSEASSSPSCSVSQGTVVPYSQLACYFCSDVTAPGNSSKDRTLDQQCTVSRPGLSPVASGVAVELMASVLQCDDPMNACANIGEPDDSTSVFGATPHQIRGFMFKFQQITPCVRRFEKCVACGPAVMEKYATCGWQFVKEVMNSPSELEKVSGLDQLHESVQDVDIDFSDNDSIMSL